MHYEELARRINEQIGKEIKTRAAEEEFFALDEELRTFISKANEEELKDFKRRCFGHEIFVKIVLGLEYEKENL